MIRPMPFWPSLEPWKKLTSVQVRIRMPRIHHGGGWSPFGSANSAGVARSSTVLSDEQQDRRQREAEQRRQQQRLADIGRPATSRRRRCRRGRAAARW